MSYNLLQPSEFELSISNATFKCSPVAIYSIARRSHSLYHFYIYAAWISPEDEGMLVMQSTGLIPIAPAQCIVCKDYTVKHMGYILLPDESFAGNRASLQDHSRAKNPRGNCLWEQSISQDHFYAKCSGKNGLRSAKAFPADHFLLKWYCGNAFP